MKQEGKHTKEARGSREQMKEQIKVNRILHHVGNAGIYYFFSPEEWMKVYMGNAILVTLKPHSRASNTGFSNTYFSVLSHLGIPVLTQKKQFRLIALLLVLPPPPTQTTGAWVPQDTYIFSKRRMNGQQPQTVFEPGDDKTTETHYPFHRGQRGVPLIALTWKLSSPWLLLISG